MGNRERASGIVGRQWACFVAGGNRIVRHVSPPLFCIARRHSEHTADHSEKAQAREETACWKELPRREASLTAVWATAGAETWRYKRCTRRDLSCRECRRI